MDSLSGNSGLLESNENTVGLRRRRCIPFPFSASERYIRLSLFVHDENLSYITLVNSSNTYNTNWMEWVDQFCIFRSVVDRGWSSLFWAYRVYTEVFFCAINLFGSDVKKRAKKSDKICSKNKFLQSKIRRDFQQQKWKNVWRKQYIGNTCSICVVQIGGHAFFQSFPTLIRVRDPCEVPIVENIRRKYS